MSILCPKEAFAGALREKDAGVHWFLCFGVAMGTRVCVCAPCRSFACILQSLKCVFRIWDTEYLKALKSHPLMFQQGLELAGGDYFIQNFSSSRHNESKWWLHSVCNNSVAVHGGTEGPRGRSAQKHAARLLVLPLALNIWFNQITFISMFPSYHSMFNPLLSFC